MEVNRINKSICSGSELLGSRGKDTPFITCSKKFSLHANPSSIERQAKLMRQLTKELISEPIASRRDHLLQGEWIQSSKLVWLKDGRGSIARHMGVLSDKGPCLYPEEALYLLQKGDIEVLHEGMPISLELSYSLLLKHVGWNILLLYNLLSDLGCKLCRHNPSLYITEYEKKLKLNQTDLKIRHKRKKVALFAESSSHPQESGPKRFQANSIKLEFIDHSADHFNTSQEVKNHNSEPINLLKPQMCLKYKVLKKQALDKLSILFDKNISRITVQDHFLLPPNAIPLQPFYKISLESLNYFSKYDETSFHWEKHSRALDYPMNGYFGSKRIQKTPFYDYSTRHRYWLNNMHDYKCNNFKEAEEGRPYWKNNIRRKNILKGYCTFPSYLLKSIMDVSFCWKDYKSAIKLINEESHLKSEANSVLWNGKTPPLVKPSHALNLQHILSYTILSREMSFESGISPTFINSAPLFDLYFSSISYKASKPKLPSARLLIPKKKSFPHRDILIHLFSYDDTTNLLGSVIEGTPRIYSLTKDEILSPS